MSRYKLIANGQIAALVITLMLASCGPVDQVSDDPTPPAQAISPTITPTRPPPATPQAAQPKPDEQLVAAEEDETYVVQPGDTLAVISSQVYGEPDQWDRIYDANRDVIGDDPDRISVGMELRIPPRE